VNQCEFISPASRALGWLFVIAFLAFAPAKIQAQTVQPIPGKPPFLSSLSPRKQHKIRVTDKETAAQIAAQGGELIADYGGFQLFEVDDSTAATLGQRGDAQDEDEQNRIALNAGVLDTKAPETQSRRGLAGAFSGKRLHLVQFAGPVRPEWRTELEASGVRVVAYIPQNAYLVYGDTGGVGRMQTWARAARHVQWDGDYSDDYKIHPRARTAQQTNSAAPATDLFAIQLVEDPEANAATLALIDQVRLAPVGQQFQNLGYLNVIVRIPPERVTDIAFSNPTAHRPWPPFPISPSLKASC
jgi:hypothetical protein